MNDTSFDRQDPSAETSSTAATKPRPAAPDSRIQIVAASIVLMAVFAVGWIVVAKFVQGSGERREPGWTDARRAERQSLRLNLGRRLAETGSPLLEAASELYEERGYRAIWLDQKRIFPRAGIMLRFLGRCPPVAFPEGLEPRRLTRALELMHRYPARSEKRGNLELSLTEAYLYCAEHLRSTAGLEEEDWDVERPEYPAPLAVLRAAAAPALTLAEVSEVFARLSSPHPQAALLEKAVTRYRAIVERGGWPRLEVERGLEQGQAMEEAVWKTLVERLRIEGFLAGDPGGEGHTYGLELEGAVRRFQARRGLLVDGKLGPDTAAALNVSAAERLAQLELNLVRSRWLKVPERGREVLVNLPAYRLWVLEDGEPIETMRVVIGKRDWPTPVFADTIEYVVVNPAWNVPSEIAKDEILPRFRREPEALIAEGFEVVVGEGPETRRYDLARLDAETLVASGADWRFRQQPGRLNPLGRIKFMLPNEHDVYLHDTSAPQYFAKARRALSHGCVRVEEPWRLASALMTRAEAKQVLATFKSGARGTSYLARPTPVSIVYFTAWVAEDGTVEMYDDVYGRDRRLSDLLSARGRDPAVRYST